MVSSGQILNWLDISQKMQRKKPNENTQICNKMDQIILIVLSCVFVLGLIYFIYDLVHEWVQKRKVKRLPPIKPNESCPKVEDTSNYQIFKDPLGLYKLNLKADEIRMILKAKYKSLPLRVILSLQANFYLMILWNMGIILSISSGLLRESGPGLFAFVLFVLTIFPNYYLISLRKCLLNFSLNHFGSKFRLRFFVFSGFITLLFGALMILSGFYSIIELISDYSNLIRDGGLGFLFAFIGSILIYFGLELIYLVRKTIQLFS